MQFFIARGEEQHGPYSLEQVRNLLQQGVLLPSDYAYHEGLSDWTPLSEVIAAQPEPATPSSKAVSQTASAGPSLSAPSASQPKSNVPVVIAIIAVLMVLGGLAAAGGWFFFLRDNEEPTKIVEAIENEEEEPSPKAGITFPAPSSPSPAKPVLPGGPPEPQTNPETQKPGTVLWEFETGFLGSVRSSPAIGSDGTVYVGSSDNKLYAIKTDSKGLAKSPWPMRGQNARHTGWVMK